mmetsp:Transcript_150483/g.273883  ORF Transcript_150483/g.273883 Transcript_150483/m.273883 type:complete len:171 (-) Transcript_150483:103-615(-)
MVGRTMLPVMTLTALIVAILYSKTGTEPSSETYQAVDESSLMQTGLSVSHSFKKRGEDTLEENDQHLSVDTAAKGNMSSKTTSKDTNSTKSKSKSKATDEHAACIKDVSDWFNGTYPCIVQQMCNYTVRVRCSDITPGGHWDYAPKACCQMPPPEFGSGPCESKCTVTKL